MPTLAERLSDEFARRRLYRYSGELQRYSKEFVEAEHPRDEGGKFTSSTSTQHQPEGREKPPDAQRIMKGFRPEFVRAVQGLKPEFARALHSLKLDPDGSLPEEARQHFRPEFLEAFDSIDPQFRRTVNGLERWALDEIIGSQSPAAVRC